MEYSEYQDTSPTLCTDPSDTCVQRGPRSAPDLIAYYVVLYVQDLLARASCKDFGCILRL